MSWAAEALKSLKKVILIEEKVATLAEDVKSLALIGYQELSERLARMEGKLEAYERAATAAVGQRRLPRPGKKKA